MKISQFITDAAGIFYSMSTGNLVTLIIFGVSAIISIHRLMKELEDEEPAEDEEFLEGGVEPWESLVQGSRQEQRKK